MLLESRLVWKNLRKWRRTDSHALRQLRLEFLCSRDEKSSPYYEIIHSGPCGNFHPLSEHLIRKFPAFDWLELEVVTRLRLGQMPRNWLLEILGPSKLGSVLASGAAGYGIFSQGHLLPLDLNNPWSIAVLAGLAYLLGLALAILVPLHMARKRLRRTFGILGYMAVLARAGETPAART